MGLAHVVAVLFLLVCAVFHEGYSQDSETGNVLTTKKTLKKLLAGEINKALDDFTCSVPESTATDYSTSLNRIEGTLSRIEHRVSTPTIDPPGLAQIEENVERLAEGLKDLPSLSAFPNNISQVTRKLTAVNESIVESIAAASAVTLSLEEAVKRIVNQTLTEALVAINEKLGFLQNEIRSLREDGSSNSQAAASCAGILSQNSSSPSGYYWVKGISGSPQRVYCEMGNICGRNTGGGWMRVAHLNMTNTSHRCPSALRQRIDYGKQTCAPLSSSPTCASVLYPSHGIHYSQVCGRIRGYNENSLNGFQHIESDLIDSIYVDGVSLTHGKTPRHHIWTFAGSRNCPCGTPPAFVGNNYFCDIGPPVQPLYVQNPMWDGENCGSNICCYENNPPWFHTHLPKPTHDSIEMRLCRNERNEFEDIAIDIVEVYVQ